MSNRVGLECTDLLLKDLMNSPLPFGGIPMLGAGDFRQVAPVVENGSRRMVIRASPRSSALWAHFQILRLHRAVRNASDPEYSEWVDSLGSGLVSGPNVGLGLVSTLETLEDALEYLYPSNVLDQYDVLAGRSFLSPVNVRVDEFNTRVLSKIPGKGVMYRSWDGLKESDLPNTVSSSTSDLSDYLALIGKAGKIPAAALHLKPGCVCTIMRNFSIPDGLVKNARVVVVRAGRRYVEVRPLSEHACNKGYLLPRINFEFKPDWAPWTVLRRQIPLRLAYACTFNSCQGLTLDRCVVDLRTPVFAHGQLYTSLTRVRNRGDLRAIFEQSDTEKTTANIVFPEILLSE